ncbi:DUF1667 domain-containing protein [Mesotoga prima]|mgnify:FL=1|jgi:CxxC motif-containing protein|uniref:DUF1667 domain-containing protein n=1 Tax=Mesotoga prima TaxID=1184387 RepID=UPI002FD92639
MAEVRNIICISCPLGCQLVVTKDGDNISVTGNTCKNGEKYGIEEMTNPKRVIPSTVVCKNGRLKRLPVKTADAVPKGMIFDIMQEINKCSVEAPVKMGQVIIPNVLGTGVDVVATRTMPAE